VDTINSLLTRLLPVKNPSEVDPADVDIDKELHRLAHNLTIFTTLKMISAGYFVNAEYTYRTARFKLEKFYTDERLAELSCVKSNKPSLIKSELAELDKDRNIALAYKNRFQDEWDTTKEIIHIYKKTRKYDTG